MHCKNNRYNIGKDFSLLISWTNILSNLMHSRSLVFKITLWKIQNIVSDAQWKKLSLLRLFHGTITCYPDFRKQSNYTFIYTLKLLDTKLNNFLYLDCNRPIKWRTFSFCVQKIIQKYTWLMKEQKQKGYLKTYTKRVKQTRASILYNDEKQDKKNSKIW